MEKQQKKSVIDSFVDGARNGFSISANSMAPNVIFAFALIQVLNLTGLTQIVGNVFQPVMSVFGLPGIAATVLMADLLSIGGGVGVAASLAVSGELSASHIAILMPGIMLMGAPFQYMGRILGTAELENKHYPIMFVIIFVNAALAMLTMRFFV